MRAKRRSRLQGSIALVLTALFLLTACASKSTSSEGGQDSKGEARKPVELKIAIGSTIPTFDPHLNEIVSVEGATELIFQSLFMYNKDANLVPELAEKWEYSADGKTFTVKIKDGFKFSSGRPVNAEAVAFSFNRMKEPNLGSPRASLYTNIVQVEAKDNLTAEFRLKDPDAHMLSLLAGALAKILDPQAVKEAGKDFGQKPVGSGPFKLVEFIGGEKYTLEQNPHWTGAKPKVDRIQWLTVPEEGTRTAMLETGQVDIIEKMSPENVTRLKDSKDVNVLIFDSMFHIGIELNMAKPPMDNPKVREALNYAVDREAMLQNILGGLGRPSDTMPGPGTENRFRVTFQPKQYDPAKAKQLLAEAGYPNGFEMLLRCPKGRYLKDDLVCQAIAGYLEKVGIKAKVEIMEFAMFSDAVNKVKPKDRPDHGAMLGRASPGIDYTLFRLFYSKNSSNVTAFNLPEMDDLLVKGRTTFDEAEQKKIYARVQEIIWNTNPHIFLWYQKVALGVRKNVKNVYLLPHERPLLRDVEKN